MEASEKLLKETRRSYRSFNRIMEETDIVRKTLAGKTFPTSDISSNSDDEYEEMVPTQETVKQGPKLYRINDSFNYEG